MLHLDVKNPSNIHPDTYSKSLLAFKPRQVLLSRHNPRITMAASPFKNENFTSLTPELKAALHESILHYLHRNGFSKTLKRFQSEAQIQSDTLKGSSFHLEDIFCKYNSCNADSISNSSTKPALENGEATEKGKVHPTNEETTTKKKKKKVAVESESEVFDKKRNESSENMGRILEDNMVDEPETKPKKKKKTKHDIDSSADFLEIDNPTVKSKDKKIRSVEQIKLETSTTNEKELVTEVAQKEKKKTKKLRTDENEIIQPDVSKKEKKSSKKRKRLSSDENENVSIEVTISKESKGQKNEILKEERSKMEEVNVQETCNKELDGQPNGKLEMDGEVKSTKKQRNATAEPKTVNAFQRVKIEQVEFAHEKLQDNSYWAKDGAEIGYGAKAQEVLGQVRGRDFRHEKTKRKRGSYRGGSIDLQSHSIKFNYSDED